MKKSFQIGFILMLTGSILPGCKKEKGAPPLLPPYESMVIDFSDFTSLKKSVEVNPVTKGTESSTWQFAATVAGVWNSLISSNAAIPRSAYDSAARYDAVYVSSNLWQWSYGFTIDGITYKSTLKGEVSTNSVVWKMYISKNITGGFTDFLWMEGTSETDGSGGQWIFYQDPQSVVQIFRTDWTKSGDVVTGVKYTYIKDDASKDSYINYLVLAAVDYDRSYNIHFSDGLYSDADIEWNSVTRNGTLKCLDYMLDDNWYCWDTNKINKLCD